MRQCLTLSPGYGGEGIRQIARIVCVLMLFASSMTFAQTAPSPSSDDALMNELAARGLTSLLDRAFELNHVPQEQRDARRALLAISQLSESSNKLNAQERNQLVARSVGGIAKVLPSLTEPASLMRQAFVLITQGIDPEVNTLEYWGENPRTQAKLRPIAQAVTDMLARATELAKAQADEVANKITSPTSPFAEQYDQVSKLAATAEYTQNMVAYDLALALDASSPQRKKVTADAIEYLTQFNVPDNPDRGAVRNRLAKLAMTQRDFTGAKKLFASTLQDDAKPGPTIPQQYEAKYFSAVCDVLDKQLAAAQTDLQNLQAWQEDHLPKDKASREGADAATSLLEYRVASLEGDLSKDPSAAKSANDRAVSMLMALLATRPELQPIIYEQLLPKLAPDANLKTLDPLLLRALVSHGEQLLQTSAGQTLDDKSINKAIDAAHELLSRGPSQNIDSQTLDATALLVGFFQQKLNQRGPAALAFLDYVEKYKSVNKANATLAMDNAQALIGQARGDAGTRDEPQVTRAYERFLPIAIDAPFNRKQFAFEFARRLQLNNKPAEALKVYAQMPADDPRQPEARFDQLVALKQQLDTEPGNSSTRPETLKRVQTLIEQTLAGNSANKPMLARMALLAADLARREQHDPARALKLLGIVDAAAKGQPDEAGLTNEAIYIRVQSLMNQQQYTQATQQLVALLSKTGGAQGAQIVYNLLQKLNEDFDRAQSADDQTTMKSLADSRAQLSEFLVDWAANNSDPNIKKSAYRYRVFDADTQRQAAELQATPEKRVAAMKQALQRFESLQSPANAELYKASLDPSAAATASDDPQVAFGLAQCQFSLGQMQPAADNFSKLINGRKLGAAILITSDNGVEKQVDNERYWEAIFKLIKADQQLGVGVDAAKDYLKLQYITWGDHVGGTKWKAQYEKLRSELIPDFDPAATTQPA